MSVSPSVTKTQAAIVDFFQRQRGLSAQEWTAIRERSGGANIRDNQALIRCNARLKDLRAELVLLQSAAADKCDDIPTHARPLYALFSDPRIKVPKNLTLDRVLTTYDLRCQDRQLVKKNADKLATGDYWLSRNSSGRLVISKATMPDWGLKEQAGYFFSRDYAHDLKESSFGAGQGLLLSARDLALMLKGTIEQGQNATNGRMALDALAQLYRMSSDPKKYSAEQVAQARALLKQWDDYRKKYRNAANTGDSRYVTQETVRWITDVVVVFVGPKVGPKNAPSSGNWEQVRLANSVGNKPVAPTLENLQGGMGLRARNSTRPGSVASRPAPAAAAPAATTVEANALAESRTLIDRVRALRAKGKTTEADALAREGWTKLRSRISDPKAQKNILDQLNPDIYYLPNGTKKLASGSHGSVYSVEGRALKIEPKIGSEQEMIHLTNLYNDGIAPAMKKLSAELAPQRIVVEAPRLKPTRIIVEGKERQGFWMPLMEEGAGWRTLREIRNKAIKNDAGNFQPRATKYEHALRQRLPEIEDACERFLSDGLAAVKKMDIRVDKLDHNPDNFNIRMGADGKITIWNMDPFPPNL